MEAPRWFLWACSVTVSHVRRRSRERCRGVGRQVGPQGPAQSLAAHREIEARDEGCLAQPGAPAGEAAAEGEAAAVGPDDADQLVLGPAEPAADAGPDGPCYALAPGCSGSAATSPLAVAVASATAGSPASGAPPSEEPSPPSPSPGPA